MGYTVLDAHSGPAALSIVREHDGPIDLLITDWVMPRMGGRELSQTLGSLYPGLKTIYISGHAEDALPRQGVDQPHKILQKPFSLAALARKVSEEMASPQTV